MNHHNGIHLNERRTTDETRYNTRGAWHGSPHFLTSCRYEVFRRRDAVGAVDVLRREITTLISVLPRRSPHPVRVTDHGRGAGGDAAHRPPPCHRPLERHGQLGQNLVIAGLIAVAETWERLRTNSNYIRCCGSANSLGRWFPGFLALVTLSTGMQRSMRLSHQELWRGDGVFRRGGAGGEIAGYTVSMSARGMF